MRTQRLQCSCVVSRQRGRTDLTLGHVGNVNVNLRIEAMHIVGGDEDQNIIIVVYCCTKRMKKFSIANMMTNDWRRFKGPPSAWSGPLEAREEVMQ